MTEGCFCLQLYASAAAKIKQIGDSKFIAFIVNHASHPHKTPQK